MLSAQIEARLGSGEGKDAKGPDMKVWSKGKNLDEACGKSWVMPYSNLTSSNIR